MTTTPGNIDVIVTGAEKAGLGPFPQVTYNGALKFLLDGNRQLCKITTRANYDQDYDISKATTITATINADKTYDIIIA